MNMFSYNIAKNANEEIFERICFLVESNIGNVTKSILLEDVDGSQVKVINTLRGEINIFNDYGVDAVYIDSEIDLKDFIK